MPKPAVAAKSAPVADPLATLADELGDLDKELAPFKTKIARVDAIRRTLRDQHVGRPSEETFTINGKKWTVMLGCKPNDVPVSASIRKGSRPITILPKAA